MKRIRVLLALALVFGMFAGFAGCKSSESTATTPAESSQPVVDEGPDRSDLLVTVDDLKANAGDYFVIDTRKADAYAAGHVPGAINLTWQELASVGVGKPGDADWGTLLPADQIGTVLGEKGVDTSKTILLYSDPTGWGEDGRVMWSLASVGITDTRMLDGGFPLWANKGGEVETEAFVAPATTVKVSASLDQAHNVTTAYLSENIGTVPVIDVRGEKEYGGATDFGEARGGFIPTAVNVPFPSFFNEDGTLKSATDLEKMFTDAGATKDGEVVFYCTKGIRSAYAAQVALWLGFDDAKNYDASFYSWAGDSSLEMGK